MSWRENDEDNEDNKDNGDDGNNAYGEDSMMKIKRR
jgi:hypothetical protein